MNVHGEGLTPAILTRVDFPTVSTVKLVVKLRLPGFQILPVFTIVKVLAIWP